MQDATAFWQHMHTLLYLASEKAAKTKLKWRECNAYGNHSAPTWAAAVTNNGEDAGKREWLVLDEASAIPARFMSQFVAAAREIKGAQAPKFGGVVLFGVHSLRMAIDAANR